MAGPIVTMATLAPNFLLEVLGAQAWAVKGVSPGWGLSELGLESTNVSSQWDDITLMPSGKPQGWAQNRDCHQ